VQDGIDNARTGADETSSTVFDSLKRNHVFLETTADLQKREPSWGHANDRSAIRVFNRHESAISGILPHGQPRTRRPPRVHGFVIGTVSAGQPFQEIKNENFDGLRHAYQPFYPASIRAR
jgi:hypothetical protein